MTERRHLDLEGFANPDGHTSKGIEAHIEELKPMFVFASSSLRAGIALSAPASSGNAGPAPPLIIIAVKVAAESTLFMSDPSR
ncbi:hypothetical protein IB267_27905 [Ensifer sp. ENS09]|uniref:hypothetical protein n=1 Tax=Ensifer sp. ENS09 TaxID=2769263 RepID=UPI00178540C2|nr:hypothetical protein [Ensifer sp. ENS09]MBD9652190.1 hypothetical protein [Ensifer sp. ENS09]